MNSQIKRFLPYLRSLNRYEWSISAILFLMLALPRSIQFIQRPESVIPLKYFWIIGFLVIVFTDLKLSMRLLKTDKYLYMFLLVILLINTYLQGLLDPSFFSLGMTLFSLRILAFFEVNIKRLNPIVYLITLLLALKWPFYSWDGGVPNMGLGNPIHSSGLILGLMFFYFKNHRYLLGILTFVALFYMKTAGGILGGVSVLLLLALLKFSWFSWVKRISVLTLTLLSLVLFFTFVGAAKSLLTEADEQQLKAALIDFEKSHPRDVPRIFGGPSFLDNQIRAKFLDISAYSRIYQTEGLLKSGKNYLLAGNSSNFASQYFFNIHNNILGIVVVFGLPLSLVYLFILQKTLNLASFRILPFLPIIATQTVVLFYGIIWIVFFIFAKHILVDESKDSD